MSNPLIRIHDMATGEILDREMTTAEFTKHEATQAEIQTQANAKTARNTARQAVLDKLNLTADEAALLLG